PEPPGRPMPPVTKGAPRPHAGLPPPRKPLETLPQDFVVEPEEDGWDEAPAPAPPLPRYRPPQTTGLDLFGIADKAKPLEVSKPGKPPEAPKPPPQPSTAARARPVEAAKPAAPAKPVEAAKPAAPAKPVEAAKPAAPAKPVEAAKPAAPAKPV